MMYGQVEVFIIQNANGPSLPLFSNAHKDFPFHVFLPLRLLLLHIPHCCTCHFGVLTFKSAILLTYLKQVSKMTDLNVRILSYLLTINGVVLYGQVPESRTSVYAKALWDHVTLDPVELGFHAGDVIEVKDMLDKTWWWGRLEDREGWFPSAFVAVSYSTLSICFFSANLFSSNFQLPSRILILFGDCTYSSVFSRSLS